MMTALQVAAIIQLLLAFNVPAQTVKEVQSLLTPATALVASSTVQVVITPPLESAQAPQIFGGTIQAMPEPTPQEDKSEVKIVSWDVNARGEYAFVLAVLDTNGKYLQTPITMTAPEAAPAWEQRVKTPNGESITNKADWTTTFVYTPKAKGEHIITFTSGNLTKSITIDVE